MHVWHIRLDPGERCLRRAWLLLDPQERERASRLRGPALARRFVAAHAATRRILASALGCHPGELLFTRTLEGKPELVSPAPMHFNLSHARHDALLAISPLSPVGIDLEDWPDAAHPAPDPHDLSPVLSEAERSRLMQQAPAQRPLECMRLWVRKEALLKARGCGLDESARDTCLPVPVPRRINLVRPPPSPDRSQGGPAAASCWSILGLERTGRWLAAVACAGPMPAPRLHAWSWTA